MLIGCYLDNHGGWGWGEAIAMALADYVNEGAERR